MIATVSGSVDGQLKTGRDVAVRRCSGRKIRFAGPADRQRLYSLCKCHLNTCPVGVAQDGTA